MHYYFFDLNKTHKNEVLPSCSHGYIEYLLSLVQEIQYLKQHNYRTMSEVQSNIIKQMQIMAMHAKSQTFVIISKKKSH